MMMMMILIMMMMILCKIENKGEMQSLPYVELVRAKRENTAQRNEGKRGLVCCTSTLSCRAPFRALRFN